MMIVVEPQKTKFDVRRHLYWCATSTKQGFEQLILAKWKSFMMHVANRHTGHADNYFRIVLMKKSNEENG